MDFMRNLSCVSPKRLVIPATIMLTVACASPVSVSCDDHAKVDAVYFESGMPTLDTVTARLVFEEYVEHVRASREPFPDGAENWLLERVSSSPWEEAPWKVSYFPEPGEPFTREVHIDRNGRVVRLVIAVHAPCGP
jgi:hypothetical protein